RWGEGVKKLPSLAKRGIFSDIKSISKNHRTFVHQEAFHAKIHSLFFSVLRRQYLCRVAAPAV
ncbi:hypothetical protein, partial [Aggregatibacter actinomycetemcomitans]|uniref:hypothetical protein n=1 Tax=Aggregatibacter actinomycetemcomitans TaxID=714 RepID=UPI001E415FBD